MDDLHQSHFYILDFIGALICKRHLNAVVMESVLPILHAQYIIIRNTPKVIGFKYLSSNFSNFLNLIKFFFIFQNFYT